MFKMALKGRAISEENIRKYLEVFVVYFRALSQPLSGRTGENIEKNVSIVTTEVQIWTRQHLNTDLKYYCLRQVSVSLLGWTTRNHQTIFRMACVGQQLNEGSLPTWSMAVSNKPAVLKCSHQLFLSLTSQVLWLETLLPPVSQTSFLTNSMEQSPTWEANSSSASQEIPHIL